MIIKYQTKLDKYFNITNTDYRKQKRTVTILKFPNNNPKFASIQMQKSVEHQTQPRRKTNGKQVTLAGVGVYMFILIFAY